MDGSFLTPHPSPTQVVQDATWVYNVTGEQNPYFEEAGPYFTKYQFADAYGQWRVAHLSLTYALRLKSPTFSQSQATIRPMDFGLTARPLLSMAPLSVFGRFLTTSRATRVDPSAPTSSLIRTFITVS